MACGRLRMARRLRWLSWLCLAGGALSSAPAQSKGGKNSVEALNQFSDSVQALVSRVAPSVVQIVVTRYGPREDNTGGRTGVFLSREQSVGSGVVVDPEGYIVTNAHVVADAHRIKVNLITQPASKDGDKPDQSITSVLAQALATPKEATLIGVFKEADLALIKIAARGLPALPFADYRKLRQGQIVFAFGSRAGLNNSVSMGVVSSVARQPERDSPFIYIQTDAPINPGDSGGPLVNTAGEIVGLNTFILSQSGGSEGMGFAIPSTLIQFVSDQLRKQGHLHRQVIGAGVQTITAPLAAALKLPCDSGILISDIQPGSPAESAGVKLNDIAIAVDGRPVYNLPLFMMALLTHPNGQALKLEVLRGGQALSLDIMAIEESHNSDRLGDFVDPERSRIPKLGILGVGIDKQTAALFPNLRLPYGVFVAARSETSSGISVELQLGDVIHEINGVAVTGVESLSQALEQVKPSDPVALFIEREGKELYVVFEME